MGGGEPGKRCEGGGGGGRALALWGGGFTACVLVTGANFLSAVRDS